MYTLGAITLPNPQEFYRDPVKVGTKHSMLDGTTKEDIITKKEVFTLVFRRLTQSQVNSIMTEYEKNSALDFAVSETNLTVNTTSVLVDMQRRAYNKGGDYREDITLILTEVS